VSAIVGARRRLESKTKYQENKEKVLAQQGKYQDKKSLFEKAKLKCFII
jgi:hypothetical protein